MTESCRIRSIRDALVRPCDLWMHAIWWAMVSIAVLVLLSSAGCGTTKTRTATEQLLLSDAVDRSISAIDFRPLSGKTVYLDSTYLQPVKGFGFVNSEYIISSLRQQIVGAGCLMQDDRKDAELIIEARVGTLGADGYAVTYGIPASNALSAAATLLPQTPAVPTIPEISFGRRESNEASAKIAAFAYNQETRQAVWQSGVSRSESDARDTWVMGIGPFESGAIRDKTKLAGAALPIASESAEEVTVDDNKARPAVDYSAEVKFRDGYPVIPGGPVQPKVASASIDPLVLDIGPDADLKQVSLEEAIEKSKEP